MSTVAKPLAGIKVLDISRVLAGPWCGQMLADMGAEVIKVERPQSGDDTRHWGPPWLSGSNESAYYLCANRGKRSVAIDFTAPEGQALIRRRPPEGMLDLIRPQPVLAVFSLWIVWSAYRMWSVAQGQEMWASVLA